MHLKILLPSDIFADKTGVVRIVAETTDGSYGFLEHRLDCVAALRPGILTYETQQGEKVYLAVDEGMLVKTGGDVLVSVRQAIAGKDLGHLHEEVQKQFLTFDKQEISVREAVKKMEAGFVSRFGEFINER